MSDAETEVLAITEQMLKAMYTADPEVHRTHCAEDMSSFEWYIAPYRIDGLDFHLRLIEAGGNGEPSHLDMLTPRVQVYGDTAIVNYTLLKTVAHGNRAAAVLHSQRDAGVRQNGRRLEDGASPQVADVGPIPTVPLVTGAVSAGTRQALATSAKPCPGPIDGEGAADRATARCATEQAAEKRGSRGAGAGLAQRVRALDGDVVQAGGVDAERQRQEGRDDQGHIRAGREAPEAAGGELAAGGHGSTSCR